MAPALLSLRSLRTSFVVSGFSQLRLSSAFHSSSSGFILNFWLKRLWLGGAQHFLGAFQGRFFVRSVSSRSSLRSTTSGGGRDRRSPHRRVEFGSRMEGQKKSLIEDESELSDWVSDLKTDSFRLGLTSDSDDTEGDSRVRGRSREWDPSSSARNRWGTGRDMISSSERSRRDDSNSHLNHNRRGQRNVKGSVSTKRFYRPSDSEEEDDLSPRNRTRKSGVRDDFSQMGKSVRRDSSVNSRSFREGRPWRKQAPLLSDCDDGDEDEDEDEEDEDDNEYEMPDFEGDDNDADSRRRILRKGEAGLPTPIPSTEKSSSYLSQTRFDQCSVSPPSLKAIEDAGYERMTLVQEATLPIILRGKDVLAKARTGTGKTVAFLLPAIEVVAKLSPPDPDQREPPINVLVVCPTRELANQAAVEANALSKYHPSIGVQVIIGGTRIAFEQKRMKASPCQILVATPGRLRDHIENTPAFATRLMGVKVLILDEADHLLDMGFRKDIEKIVEAVPKQRQTLLFSATVPEEVRQICYIALKRDHEFINTVEEGSEETHSQVRQAHLLASLDNHFSILYALLKEHISEDVDYKVLVFCTTAMMTKMVADLLSELNLNVREIHSRKSQSYRTRISDEFRKSKGLILVTSDVSARGVDYPDVTLVVQMGVPPGREQYIHRLGRTGRKGKEGKGILLLAPWEDFFISSIRDLPIVKASLPVVDPDLKKRVERALSHVEVKNKEAAYQAWLGYYNSNKNVGKDKFRLVELANEFSRSMGLDSPPAVPKLILSKMGLRNVPGLRTK